MAGSLMVARLGLVEFSVPTGTFDEITRSTRWNVDVPTPIDGLGTPVGRGQVADEMTIRGVVFPGFSGNRDSVQRLRDQADTGKSYPLTDGLGFIHGFWIISAVNERKQHFTSDGFERKVEWDISLIADPDGGPLPI